MPPTYRRPLTGLGVILAASLALPACPGQEIDFAKRQQDIRERLEKNKGNPPDKDVHDPPLVKAGASDLGDEEPVLGVSVNKEARAYPLTMLFGGGGLFELVNDTCGGEPIAASW